MAKHSKEEIGLEQWITDYRSHLENTCGLSAATQRSYTLIARRFLTSITRRGRLLIAKITPAAVIKFVKSDAAPRKGQGPNTTAAATKSFLRFLISKGHVKRHLVEIVPRLRCYRNSALPSSLSDTEIEQVLRFSQDGSSKGIRNYALLMLFSRLGLRADEAARVDQVTQVLAIPAKRSNKRLVNFLSRSEIDALIAAPDLTNQSGRRDHALLLTLYNTGARASEIIGLEPAQVSFGSSSFISLHGKGRKERTVPLWSKTTHTLKSWFKEIDPESTNLAFPSATRQKLTRNGLDYILQRAVETASTKCPSLRERNITPHMVRHTTATHLLQSGVDISVIALWLGHEHIETTHIYLATDLATKEEALNKLAPAGVKVPRYRATDEVLAFLGSL